MYIATTKEANITRINTTKPNWRLVVDQKSLLNPCYLYNIKSGMIKPAYAQLNCCNQAYKPVNIIQIYNYCENIKI